MALSRYSFELGVMAIMALFVTALWLVSRRLKAPEPTKATANLARRHSVRIGLTYQWRKWREAEKLAPFLFQRGKRNGLGGLAPVQLLRRHLHPQVH